MKNSEESAGTTYRLCHERLVLLRTVCARLQKTHTSPRQIADPNHPESLRRPAFPRSKPQPIDYKGRIAQSGMGGRLCGRGKPDAIHFALAEGAGRKFRRQPVDRND